MEKFTYFEDNKIFGKHDQEPDRIMICFLDDSKNYDETMNCIYNCVGRFSGISQKKVLEIQNLEPKKKEEAIYNCVNDALDHFANEIALRRNGREILIKLRNAIRTYVADKKNKSLVTLITDPKTDSVYDDLFT